MIAVGSGFDLSLPDSTTPQLPPALDGEAVDLGGPNIAEWLSTCVQDHDFEELIGSLTNDFLPTAEPSQYDFSQEVGLPGAEPSVAAASYPMSPAPPSPATSDSSGHRSSNPVPRHQRPSHKRAELKRRDKIKTRLEDLKAQVPSIADKGKMSESAILSKAAEYTRHLKADCERFTTEAGSLRQEIETLSSEIHTFQEHLPATGLKGEEQKQQSLDDMYNNYVASRTRSNWKFWVFSFLTRPMYDSYKASVITTSCKEFIASLGQWLTQGITLANIRKMMLGSVLRFSKETRIMTEPESLREEALTNVTSPSTGAVYPMAGPSSAAAGLTAS